MTEQDKIYMQRCLQLAENARGKTSPNPMVGSVIVHNGEIIGEGYHVKCGQPHAEVNAIASVKDKSLLEKSTIYVNLEPCSHYGKTPPCADLIVSHKIPRVVIGSLDPNPLVSGRGAKRIEEAGAKVDVGLLEAECKLLNARFYTYQIKNRPYVILKWAQTLDGFIDIDRECNLPERPTWITHELSRRLVHKWRSEEDAIVVGTETAFKDNPSLNVRDWHGKSPLRLVVDNTLRLPDNLALFDGTLPTVVYNSSKNSPPDKNIEYSKIDFEKNLPQEILNDLYKRGMQSLIVEGGARLLQSFIDANLWDEAKVFVGNTRFIQGVEAPHFPSTHCKEESLQESNLYYYRNSAK